VATKSSAVAVSRPGRALAVLALLIVGMYTAMALTGNWTPNLGLDLQGGTSITLIPKPAEGEEAPSDEQIDRAIELLERRVNAQGVAEPDIQAQGSGSSQTIVISLPGATQQDLVDSIGKPYRMDFRPVLAATAGVPAPEPTAEPTASPSASPSASPTASPSASPAGRALPQGLAAVPSPTPSPTTEPSPPAPGTDPTLAALGISPELQQEFLEKDCTDPDQRGQDVETPGDPIVACSTDGTTKYLLAPVAVAGSDLTNAEAGIRQDGTGVWVVNLEFNGEGTAAFRETTEALVSKTGAQNAFAIVLDGEVITAPGVTNAIVDGRAEISGDFNQSTAKELASNLDLGALPISFEVGTAQTVSSTLGADYLEKALIAGAVGLLLVVLYSLLYYRGLGIVSIFSLAVAAAVTYALVVLLDVTLILAGVAGAIVAIGITADSFVVYFERIRDEVREGKTLRVAVETGWKRARRTILSADFVSILAAAVLFFVSVGNVRVFAFILGLTTLVDILIVFLFTKPMIVLLARTKFFGGGHKWSGLDPAHLGMKTPGPMLLGRRPAAPAAKEA
jgi:preprotein translocase subunit SecD